MYLQYTLSTDLSISIEDLNVDPANPGPGTNTTITAKIKNIGESPAQNVQVAFYDGNPPSGGTLIDAINTITNPIQHFPSSSPTQPLPSIYWHQGS
jgi:hypothetical protein